MVHNAPLDRTRPSNTHSGFMLLATLSLCQYYQSSTVFEGFCHVERELQRDILLAYEAERDQGEYL